MIRNAEPDSTDPVAVWPAASSPAACKCTGALVDAPTKAPAYSKASHSATSWADSHDAILNPLPAFEESGHGDSRRFRS